MTDMSTGSYYYRLNIGINTLCMITTGWISVYTHSMYEHTKNYHIAIYASYTWLNYIYTQTQCSSQICSITLG